MRAVRLVSGMLMVGSLLAGVASGAGAAYRPQDNVVVNVQVPGVRAPNAGTASTTFAVQQGAHAMLQRTVGTDPNYSYIWVKVNGQPVAAIDPLCVYN